MVNHPLAWFFPLLLVLLADSATAGEPRKLRLGTQPLAVPSGMVFETLIKSPELERWLDRESIELEVRSYHQGSQVISDLRSGKLDGGIAGDGPVLIGAGGGLLRVLSQVKLNFASLVSRNVDDLVSLRGGRIGYAPLSTAHFATLHALSSVNVPESEVEWLPIPPDRMADALIQGEIDAFAAWEPIVDHAIHDYPNLRVLFRGISAGWLFLSSEWAANRELVEQLRKAAARAVNLLQRPQIARQSIRQSISRASYSAIDSHLLRDGHFERLVIDGLIRIYEPGRIDPHLLQAGGRLAAYYSFMLARGRLPDGANSLMLQDAFAPMVGGR